MSDQMSGVVVSVESARQGVIATGWVGTELSVWNAADIDRDGCDLTPDDGATLYHATGEVVEGATDDDPDVVTMAVSAPSDWPAGGTDDDGQTIPTDTRLDLWPEVLDVVAQVDIGDGDPIPVVVPHALRPLLSEGLRDPDSREQVVCESRGTGWVIADVIGRRGEIGVDGLAADVVQSIEAAAASGVRRWDSINEPDSDGHGAGDIWFQHDTALTGKTIGQWHWDGTSWIKDQIADAVLANIDAGKIVGGTLSGLAGIYSPDPSSLPRTQIVGSTISVIRAGAEGEDVTTVQLGGTGDDQLMISDTDGSPLGGIDTDGNVLAQDANVSGNLSVGGQDLWDILNLLPYGVCARQKLGSTSSLNSIQWGETELGLLELSIDAQPGKLYRAVFDGLVYITQGRSSLGLRYTADGSAPTIISAKVSQADQLNYQGSQTVVAGHIEGFLPILTSPATLRVLLTGFHATPGGHGRITSGDSYQSDFIIEDCGIYQSFGDGALNNGNGTAYAGSSTTTPPSTARPKQTYTKSWTVAATRTWRNGSVVSDKLMQGYYSPGQRCGLWLFDGSPSTAMAGATISSLKLTVQNVDFPMTPSGQSGILRLGHYDSTGLPGSPQTSGGGAVSVTMRAGQKLAIGLPGGWWDGIASGAIRGFTLGEVGTGSANTPSYGHFSPTATLTATYTK